MAKLPPPFFLIVRDSDRNTFSVEGPMQDDRRWNSAVHNAQVKGRQVGCSSAHAASPESAARSYAAEYPDFTRVPSGSIVSVGL